MKTKTQLMVMTKLMIVGTLYTAKASAAPVAIGIQVPGIDGSIPARVAPNGDVTIDHYPSRFDGSLKILSLASPVFGSTLNEATCMAVKDRAMLAADESYPVDLRRMAADQVRKDNAIALEISVASFFATPEFLAAAKAAAVQAGVRAPSFQITNPLSGDAFDVGLELAADAITRELGAVEGLGRQLRTLLQSSGGLATGTSQGEVGAADLACDLWSGKVRLVVKVSGTVRRDGAREPLFEADVARSFYEHLQERLGTTPESFTAAQKLIAGGVATAAAAAEAQATLTVLATGIIAQNLFDPRSGDLLEIPVARIPEVLSAPSAGDRFEGQSTIVIHQ